MFVRTVRLPLWTPSQVSIGAVGYHDKMRGGEFITLFNSFNPAESSGGRTKDMPSVHGYGNVNKDAHRQDKVQRNVLQRGINYMWQSLSSLARVWSGGQDNYTYVFSFILEDGT